MTVSLHYFPVNEAEAQRLGAALEIAAQPVSVRQFPDGESLVRVERTEPTALLYCSLDRPDGKLMPLLLAASALRDGGASRLVLIAPYLAYMRQDKAFASGEAVSQRVIGDLIASAFDGLITVDPHLHRTPSLAPVMPGIETVNLSAAASIAQAIAPIISSDTILVGPDEESYPWVEAIARPLGLDMIVGTKTRHGDRKVDILLPDRSRVAGHPVLLVDDLISSGGTLIACADQLLEAGATRVGAVATHCLATGDDLDRLRAHRVSPVMATDTVPGPVASISMAPALADAIRSAGFA